MTRDAPRVYAEIDCPRCGERRPQDVELRFSRHTDEPRVTSGGFYPWLLASRPHSQVNGGNASGLSWTLCSACGMDFFVLAQLRDFRLTELRSDPEQLPNHPDGLLYAVLECSRHGIAEHEVRLCAGVGRRNLYRIGDEYIARGEWGATLMFRAEAVCAHDKSKPHGVFVMVDVTEGVLTGVRVDPNQSRTSLAYFTGTLFP